LLVNGVPHGAVESDTNIFRWTVALPAGANRIEARAGSLADACTITGVAP